MINLHNLQMLFMLWIQNKFSECLAPLHKHETPNGRLHGDGCAQAADTVGHSGAVTQNLFCAPQILLCSEKIVLNIW